MPEVAARTHPVMDSATLLEAVAWEVSRTSEARQTTEFHRQELYRQLGLVQVAEKLEQRSSQQLGERLGSLGVIGQKIRIIQATAVEVGSPTRGGLVYYHPCQKDLSGQEGIIIDAVAYREQPGLRISLGGVVRRMLSPHTYGLLAEGSRFSIFDRKSH
jgi:hypothetical protein